MISEEKNIVRLLQDRQFKEAERAAIALVKKDPFHAQGWVFLGEALMHQGYKETATKVFERASLLDPEATWIDHVETALAKLEDDLSRIDIEVMMELPPVTVAAVMIVKDEERCIVRCLDSLQGAVDDIIVLDTGSTDKTIDYVRQYPQVKLYHGEWHDDFSLARNEVF